MKRRANLLPKTIEVKKVVDESPRVKTFVFNESINAMPGQFVMLWIPGVNEKPFGISRPDPLTVTVARVSEFTQKLHEKKAGDRLAYRGPFGKGFELVGKKILLVAGGYGAAPLRFLAEEAAKKRMKTTVVLGAKTASDVILKKAFEQAGCDVVVTTDDGSAGIKGLCTDTACGLLDKERFDCVYSCGPETMMKKLGEECVGRRIPCQLGLERFFKCGIGVCGQCSLDGFLVCRDGPVFDAGTVLATEEFGRVRRDASGKKIML